MDQPSGPNNNQNKDTGLRSDQGQELDIMKMAKVPSLELKTSDKV